MGQRTVSPRDSARSNAPAMSCTRPAGTPTADSLVCQVAAVSAHRAFPSKGTSSARWVTRAAFETNRGAVATDGSPSCSTSARNCRSFAARDRDPPVCAAQGLVRRDGGMRVAHQVGRLISGEEGARLLASEPNRLESRSPRRAVRGPRRLANAGRARMPITASFPVSTPTMDTSTLVGSPWFTR